MNEYLITIVFLVNFLGLIYFIWQTKKLIKENLDLKLQIIETKIVNKDEENTG